MTTLSNRLTATGSATYRKRFGIGVVEFRLLAVLATGSDISPTRIAEVMGMDNGAISRTLRAMETRGLVSSRSDGRNSCYKLWSLTAAGAELQDRAVLVSMQRDDVVAQDLSADEKALLVSMLHRMLGSVPQLYELAREG